MSSKTVAIGRLTDLKYETLEGQRGRMGKTPTSDKSLNQQ